MVRRMPMESDAFVFRHKRFELLIFGKARSLVSGAADEH